MESIDYLVFFLMLVWSLQLSMHRNKSRPVSLDLLNVINLTVFFTVVGCKPSSKFNYPRCSQNFEKIITEKSKVIF